MCGRWVRETKEANKVNKTKGAGSKSAKDDPRLERMLHDMLLMQEMNDVLPNLGASDARGCSEA